MGFDSFILIEEVVSLLHCGGLVLTDDFSAILDLGFRFRFMFG